MKSIWMRMDAHDLDGYSLLGGTALAMYLNHRKSTDFDFFRTDGGAVQRSSIERWGWLREAQFRGSIGMVDAAIPCATRTVTLNFVSIDDFNGIEPSHPPVQAENGVMIGHPIDILTGKLAAMSNRRATRDYWDVACAFQMIPDTLVQASDLYLADQMSAECTRTDLAKSILAFPLEVEHELPRDLLASLSDFANALGGWHSSN